MKKKAKKTYDDDDGRVIAPMNVDGMPWYNPYAEKSKNQNSEHSQNQPREKLSKKETFKLIMKLYAALIPIALVFILGFTILILLMYYFW